MRAYVHPVLVLALASIAIGQERDGEGVSKLDAALVSLARVEFVQTPLSDVAEYMQDLVGVPVVLDRRGLARAKLDGKVPITYRGADDVPLYLTLDRMLRPLGLGWVAEGEVIMLTTNAVASTRLTSRTYYVGDLAWWAGPAELAQIVAKTIEPASWSNVGGAGTIKATGTQLVVTQNQSAHRQIIKLLNAARRRRRE